MATWTVAKIDRGFGAERAMKRHPKKIGVLLVGWTLGVGTVARAANDAWLVGPGLDFPDLVSGVAGAADGDLLLVVSTPQQDVVIDDKSIRIVGLAVPTATMRSITIRNLSASRVVEVRGVDFKKSGLPVSDGPTIRVENCSGFVRFEECETSQLSNQAWSGSASLAAGAEVLSSNHVSFTGCVLRGGSGKAGFNPDWTSPEATPAWDGAPGIRSVHSSVVVSDSAVRGGSGGPVIQDIWGEYSWKGADGGAAVLIEGGRFFLSGGALYGGDPGNPGVSTSPFGGEEIGEAGLGGPCIANWTGNAVVFGMTCEPGGINARPSLKPVTVHAAAARSLKAPRVIEDGGSLTLTYDGVAGDAAIAFGSTATDFQAFPSGQLGVWMLGPPALVGPIALPVVGPTGSSVAVSVVLPALPAAFEFVSMTFQAATADSLSGATILSSPTIVAEVSESVPISP